MPHVDPTVDLSVLIATRDRAASLSRTLAALQRQELHGLTWELIVIDNGSTDDTPAVLAEAGSTLPLVVLEETEPGKNRALNRALDSARGKLLVFTDDDVLPDREWLAALHAAAARWPEDSVFGGRIDPRFPPATPAWLTRADFKHAAWAFARYCPRIDEGPTGHPPFGPNMAVRARIMRENRFSEAMGPRGRDYAMGSETELLLRLFRQGEQFVFVPAARLQHVVRTEQLDKRSLVRRVRRLGRGDARLHPEVGSLPIFGLPLALWLRTVQAVARWLATRARPRPARWAATLDLQRLLGNIGERRAMMRERRSAPGDTAPQRRFPTFKAAYDAVKWAGAGALAAKVLLLALRPVARLGLGRRFQTDLAELGPVPPYAGGITTQIHRGSERSRQVRVALGALETLAPETIDERLARGDVVAMALCEGAAVGYVWSTSAEIRIEALGASVAPGAREVIGYDAHVARDWRGKRVFAALDACALQEARRSGAERHIVFVDALNRPAVRALGRVRQQAATRLCCLRLRGTRRPFRWPDRVPGLVTSPGAD